MFRKKAEDFNDREKWLWIWANDYSNYRKEYNHMTGECTLWSPYLKGK